MSHRPVITPGSQPTARLRSRRHALVVLAIAGLLAIVVSVVTAVTDGPGGRLTAPASAREPDLGRIGAPGWISTGHEITSGGLRRGYLVVRPASTTAAHLPVVVLLHGRNMTPAAMATRSGLLRHRDLVLVVPAGYGRSWNAGGCCAAARKARVDDVAFLSATVQQVLARYSVADPRAVYLAGYSNGGRMAYRMACRRPGMFRAVAAVEAVPVDDCAGVRRPVPLLVVASSADPLLRIRPGDPPHPIEGRPQTSVEDAVRVWRTLDGCPRTAGVRDVTGTLTALTWRGCLGGTRIRYDLYAGGSHAWPAGSARTPSAQAEIWSFFRST